MRVQREKIQLPEGHSFRVLRWSRHLRDVECILSPHQSKPVASEGTHWHFHPEMELTLFTSGIGTRFVGDHIGHFASGDLVLLGERLPHYWHTNGSSSGLSIQWHFFQSHAFWNFPEALEMSELFKKASRGLRITGKTAINVTATMSEITRLSGIEQLSALLKIFAMILRAPEGERATLSHRSFSLSAGSSYQQSITKAIRHLIAHFREEIRLEHLLEITQMSRPTFARQFKRHSGHTFSEFLNRLRLQTACRELIESDRGILDISLSCGFTQISFFNRLFRRMMKCNPTQYRVAEKKKLKAKLSKTQR